MRYRIPVFVIVFWLACALIRACAAERVKVTTYAAKYDGRCCTASGERYDPRALTCATNREAYYGKTLWLYRGWLRVAVRCNDRFHSAKFALPFVKLDLTPRAMRALNLRGTAWIDSVKIAR